ncbi:prephenate dehydratase [Methanococcus voltae]|uniref:prephenate dehydratase n=2 Tax=Methanococcus voltae TaxID=2188 RepID=A0A8J7RH91_METVO|nr:prephenate dehydratase [Methanococcus voltae]MBP2172167.1 prephenate dehydratase [Methanococcus voltae]MBP2200876.1 prephenate dehydratase [Methanococcus voltae]MCS3921600.1 prephenate dehydratase [Methanococcus voltae PS]
MIYCLGPMGSYSEKAAKLFAEHLKNSEEIIYCNSINEIFEKLEKLENSKCEDNRLVYGVVPSENSIEGSVTLTQDLLMETNVNILAEIDINIEHALVSTSTNKNTIKRVLSHPQALAQCRNYINSNHWVTETMESTALSAKTIAEKQDKELSAICSEANAEIYDLNILDKNIQDYKNNQTRFLLISKKQNKEYIKDINFGIDDLKKVKSTVILELKENRAGSLYDVLGEFKKLNIDLSRIESRPSKTKLGTYVFYMDFEYYENMDELFDKLDKWVSKLVYLGTYFVL